MQACHSDFIFFYYKGLSMIKNQYVLYSSLLITSALFAPPPTDHDTLLKAIKNGDHRTMATTMQKIEAQHAATTSRDIEMPASSGAAGLGMELIENAPTIINDVEQVVSAVSQVSAAMKGGTTTSAQAAQSQAQGAPAQASSVLSSPLLQAAIEAENAAKANSGTSTRVLLVLLGLGCWGLAGLSAVTDWYSTQDDTSAQKTSKIVSDLPNIGGWTAAGIGCFYQAYTNNITKSAQAKAALTTKAVRDHVTQTSK